MADTMTLEGSRDYLLAMHGGYECVSPEFSDTVYKRMADAIDAAIEQRERDKRDAARYRWLAQYPNLFTVNDLLRADQYTTLTRACDALMPTAAMAKESGNG